MCKVRFIAFDEGERFLVVTSRLDALRFLDVAFASFSRLAKRIAPGTTVLLKKSCYPLQNVQIITLLLLLSYYFWSCYLHELYIIFQR